MNPQSLAITFIVCTYGNSNELKDTLSSLAFHIEGNDEVIIVDGDKKAFQKNQQLIDSILGSQHHYNHKFILPRGVYNAINHGVCLARNEWINIIHSGDIVVAESIEIIRKSIKLRNSDIIICNQKYGPSLDRCDILNAKDHPTIVPHQSTFYKCELHDNFGLYDETKISVSDQIFFKKAINLCKVNYLPIIYCFYNTNGLSSNFNWRVFLEEISIEEGVYKKLLLTLKAMLKFSIGLLGPSFMHKVRSFKNKLIGRFR